VQDGQEPVGGMGKDEVDRAGLQAVRGAQGSVEDAGVRSAGVIGSALVTGRQPADPDSA
jgi:hypothetical protein